jgi:hypothetical protein
LEEAGLLRGTSIESAERKCAVAFSGNLAGINCTIGGIRSFRHHQLPEHQETMSHIAKQAGEMTSLSVLTTAAQLVSAGLAMRDTLQHSPELLRRDQGAHN